MQSIKIIKIIIKIDYQCHLDYAYTYIIEEKPKGGFNYKKPDLY